MFSAQPKGMRRKKGDDMRTRRRRWLAIAAASLCLVAAPMAGVAQADPAPTCVVATVHEDDSPDWASVTNRCSTAPRVKMVIAFESDSPCTQLNSPEQGGQVGFLWHWADWGRFDGVESC
jgi:hypothetical protein